MPMFGDLLIVVAVAFAAPFVLGLLPGCGCPRWCWRSSPASSIGPSVLGLGRRGRGRSRWSRCIGLAFVLFLAGLEIEFARLRGRVLQPDGWRVRAVVRRSRSRWRSGSRRAGSSTRRCSWRSSCARPRWACSIPVLKDAGEISSTFGQLVVAAGSIADFGAIILLSIFFSGEGGIGATLLLLGGLFLLAAVVGFLVSRRRALDADPRRPRCACRTRPRRSACAARWCCSSASPRSREKLGLEVILGAFVAGRDPLAASTATR